MDTIEAEAIKLTMRWWLQAIIITMHFDTKSEWNKTYEKSI